MKAISLFSGAGGDTLGLEQADVDVIAFVEINDTFIKTHLENFPNCELIGKNIKDIPDESFRKYSGKIDIIFSGFPCNSFSTAGKRKRGDERDDLFKEFIRACKIIKPKFVIGENVKGLLTKKDENNKLFIDIIKDSFKNIGYTIHTYCINSSHFEVPQSRERVLLIGVNNTVKFTQDFKMFSPQKIDKQCCLKDIITYSNKGICKFDFDFLNIPNECIQFCDKKENNNSISQPHPYLKRIMNISNFHYKDKTFKCLFSFGKRDSPYHCEIIDIRKPCKTIICSYKYMPRLFVLQKKEKDYFLRCLTIDELKQIQGFPKDYKVRGNEAEQITQIGNAVPPPLVKNIVNQLKLFQ